MANLGTYVVLRVHSSVLAEQLYIVDGSDPVACSWHALAPMSVVRLGHSSFAIVGL